MKAAPMTMSAKPFRMPSFWPASAPRCASTTRAGRGLSIGPYLPARRENSSRARGRQDQADRQKPRSLNSFTGRALTISRDIFFEVWGYNNRVTTTRSKPTSTACARRSNATPPTRGFWSPKGWLPAGAVGFATCQRVSQPLPQPSPTGERGRGGVPFSSWGKPDNG